MNTVKTLEKQDREIEQLFDQYHKVDDASRRIKLFKQISELMAENIKVEQTILYPAAVCHDLDEQIKESIAEHLSVKRVIVDLLEIIHGTDGIDPHLRALRDLGPRPLMDKSEDADTMGRPLKGMSFEERAAISENIDRLFSRLMSQDPRYPSISMESAEPAEFPKTKVAHKLH